MLKKVILSLLITFILLQIVKSSKCTCNQGDFCCCPNSMQCCNTPGKCCCVNQYGEILQSLAHQFVPTLSVQEKLSNKNNNLQGRCAPDCFFGNICGDYCRCDWPNCTEIRPKIEE
ncbi:hypothetical protein TTHERM_00049210 (macronuclear) [Tetrahymena thermophila SB210]|uniref:Transmembrane protein n=1 Tax=Tetrahymena thermophila (strain SB210) TaxID=312017 RepID=Q23D70_TETTS|nr:hypothetical protein TTHERM_00049210 [Tetrahymena thermophila SB210]EAR94418.1 hypothetical protein TTHERM_00049210 [Tetrahymena thermophila SB210]|eukprot:XP_001014816.1 hypothetical protein TTHERM_00049210 [Tetrahymena thermophila SB210]